MKNIEHLEQVALFQWMAVNASKHPALSMAFSIPNGGHRHIAVARKLKAEGVKAGVPDIFIPFPRVILEKNLNKTIYHGMFIEMKSEKGKISEKQGWWIDKLTYAGYYVKVCRGWVEAARLVCWYLGIDTKAAGVGERD